MLVAACLVLLLFAGCRPRAPRQPLQDQDPIFVIPAIQETAETERLRDVPRLIELLESEDSAIRLYSIQALRRLTGETFGYRSWDDAQQREEAVNRWKRFAAELGLIPAEDAPPETPATQPATSPAPAE